MKRNYFKNTGSICLVIGLLATTLLSSCLKDNSPGTIDFSKSPALVSFQYAGLSAKPYAGAILPIANSTYTAIEVTLSVPSVTLSSAVTVNIVDDPAGVDSLIAQDAAKDITDHVMPTSLYTMPSSVTIPAGQTKVVVPLVVPTANTLDFTQNYVIGKKLSGPKGAQLTSNLNGALIRIILKSQYEGSYDVSGFVFRNVGGVNDPALGGNFSGFSQALTTISAYQVSWAPLWANGQQAAGVTNTSITVNPATNKVTMGSADNSSLGNAPGYDNRYDPATKTFYISYTWSGGARAETDTLTLK